MHQTALGAIQLWATSKQEFDAFVRLVRFSAAEPPTFAIPVDAKEDSESYTVVFHVANREQKDLSVQGTDHQLLVWGTPWNNRREMRMCTFPRPIAAKSFELSRTGELLTVRVPKLRPPNREPKGTKP